MRIATIAATTIAPRAVEQLRMDDHLVHPVGACHAGNDNRPRRFRFRPVRTESFVAELAAYVGSPAGMTHSAEHKLGHAKYQESLKLLDGPKTELNLII